MYRLFQFVLYILYIYMRLFFIIVISFYFFYVLFKQSPLKTIIITFNNYQFTSVKIKKNLFFIVSVTEIRRQIHV